MSTAPNIVFLLNDHQAHYRHGWDGGPKIQRPHFDRLAAEGIVFDRAYTACPLCGPARRTMLTGLFPHNHGEIRNDSNHPFDRETYYDGLAGLEYRNYYFGKWHAGPGTAYDHHCEGFSYPSYNNPYTKPEYKEYLQARDLPEADITVERDFMKNGRKHGDHMVQDQKWCNEHTSGIMEAPNDTHEAFFLANLACDQLRQLAQSSTGQPFCLRVDFWGPHQPYFPTRQFADLYSAGDIPEYGSFRDSLADKPRIYRSEYNVPMSDGEELIFPNPLPWEEWQKTLALCYAQITMVDAAGGRVLKTLDELGLSDNTLVIWTTDHGDALACHGGHFDKRSYMPEEMVRIPMAIRYPGVVGAGQTNDKLVSNIDLAPTILDAAGTGFQHDVDGTSLLPLCVNSATDWRDDLMCETHGHGDPHIGRLVVTDRHKFAANKGDLDELYDLRDDPYELTNLVGNPACAPVLVDMKRRLSQWQRGSGDGETRLS
jgi:arylsulfatase A-like enzyme